jgi:predicted ATPase/DNA-binding XRE family transcriptional regulator
VRASGGASRQVNTNPPVPSFGDVLRRYRLASGLSQETLAERARVSSAAISALERGARRAPYRETVALLAEALGLSNDERVVFAAAADRVRGRGQRAGAETRSTHNLPVRLTSFVGRDDEIAEIKALLESRRLITLTGSGGIGKTRTAIEVGRQLLDAPHEEVWFVDLSPLGDGGFVAGAIASVLDVQLAQVADPIASLATALKAREFLLILDNCEHVIADAADAAGAILRGCPSITILATSRERLAIGGEQVYRLPSLPIPATSPQTTEKACTYASFRLFMERAKAVEGTLELNPERIATVSEICRQLEGIPLAIELTATRLPALGLDALNKRLKEHFVTAGGVRDLPERHRTMVATIDWSYALLSEPERTLFRRLAVFRGGVTIEGAEAVCADESLPSNSVAEILSLLVNKSLLNVIAANESNRYVMLESVRAFALSKLTESGEFTPLARAHAGWLGAVADLADAMYKQIAPARWRRDFGAEIDNARGALEWALNNGTDGDVLLAGRIVGGLRGLWMQPERRVECRRWVEAALDRLDATRQQQIVARLMLAYIQSIDGSAVFAAAERAIPLFERIGDRRGLISLHAHLAWEYGLRGAFTEAETQIALAFALAGEERLQRSRQFANLLQARCLIRALSDRLDEARIDAAEASRLRTDLGYEDLRADFYWEAFFAFTDGDVRLCAELLQQSADHARAQSQSPAGPLSELAAVRIVLGDIDAARSAARDALEVARSEQLASAWRAIQHLAAVAAIQGQTHTAARLMGFVDAWCEREGGFRGYYERASYDVLTAALRNRLSPDAIAMLAAEGADLDYEGAIDEALAR